MVGVRVSRVRRTDEGYARGAEPRQTILVHCESAVGEFVRASNPKAHRQFCVIGMDKMNDPIVGCREDRVALSRRGQAHQRQRRIHRHRAEHAVNPHRRPSPSAVTTIVTPERNEAIASRKPSACIADFVMRSRSREARGPSGPAWSSDRSGCQDSGSPRLVRARQYALRAQPAPGT